MNPAPSVIIFTVLSGLGFGLLAWLGLGFPQETGLSALLMFAAAYVLAVGGLWASTFHLGNRQNALKAFSQWRTSWLSREACLSVATLVIMGFYALDLILLGHRFYLLGFLGALCALGTVFTTSMIYTQLKTVPRWHQPGTPVLFLSLALAGGAMLTGVTMVAVWFLIAAGIVQAMVWSFGDQAVAHSKTNLATATGLGRDGQVRQMEPPHTGNNYLLNEMVYVVGRKHARNLRIAAILAMSVLPAVFVLVVGAGGVPGTLALICHLAGVSVSRWLFFAEAEHVVGIYYDRP